MKTTTLTKIVIGLTLIGAWGCSNGNKSNTLPSPGSSTSTSTTSTDTTNCNFTGDPGAGFDKSVWGCDGSMVTFRPKSFSVMNSWVGLHPLNDPKNFKVKVNLNKTYKYNTDGSIKSGPYYAGSVSVGYTDTGVWYQSSLTAEGNINVSCSGCNNNNELETEYNYFYKNTAGQIVFSGFFQDAYGALVLVLTPSTSTGADAESGVHYDGKLFYRNFAQSLNPQSPYRKCWFITAGPYECDSSTVMMKNSTDSVVNYTYLGSFTGLSATAAIQH